MMQIIGVVLVKDEDLHIAWVLNNILEFCDVILVLDNYSTDATYDIIADLAKQHPKIKLQRWRNARASQQALREYYATDTWLFRVDGDEIHNPAQLRALRERILADEFADTYSVSGGCLNCASVDFANQTARGYPAPPAAGGGGLFNMNLVTDWQNENRERLHGHPIFRQPPARQHVRVDDFKCLHLCFMQRSSKQYSFANRMKERARRLFGKHWDNPLNARPAVKHKKQKDIARKIRDYAVGEIVEESIARYLPKS